MCVRVCACSFPFDICLLVLVSLLAGLSGSGLAECADRVCAYARMCACRAACGFVFRLAVRSVFKFVL